MFTFPIYEMPINDYEEKMLKAAAFLDEAIVPEGFYGTLTFHCEAGKVRRTEINQSTLLADIAVTTK